MKNIRLNRIFSLLLAIFMMLSLAACAGTPAESSSTPDTTETTEPEETLGGEDDTPTLDTTLPVRISVLNGTTGFGMAKLMNDHKNGGAALNYTFNVETDAANINAGLIKGEI
ncbi:MAG: hypothetical protein J6B12_05250, partial [Clostridia bacterium]|nr:hypothetical protein [Clostridia bacterium]